jgi:hypothetical protein
VHDIMDVWRRFHQQITYTLPGSSLSDSTAIIVATTVLTVLDASQPVLAALLDVIDRTSYPEIKINMGQRPENDCPS